MTSHSPCPRQRGLGECEGSGTNSDTWVVVVSTWASVVPPRVGGWGGGSRITTSGLTCCPIVVTQQDPEDSQQAHCYQAELKRPPAQLQGPGDSLSCLGGERRTPPIQPLPSLPELSAHVLTSCPPVPSEQWLSAHASHEDHLGSPNPCPLYPSLQIRSWG